MQEAEAVARRVGLTSDAGLARLPQRDGRRFLAGQG